jgi:hypothetical protein
MKEETQAPQQQEPVFMSGVEPSSGHYATFDRDVLVAALKVFVSMSRPLQDIHARTCFFKRKGNVLLAEMSDGVIFSWVSIQANFISENFPDECALDFESLYKIASYADKSVCIVVERSSFYMNFVGGKVFIPSFNIVAKDRMERKLRGLDLSKFEDITSLSTFMQSLEVSHGFLGSNPYSELDFVFSGDSGNMGWVSNKSSVLRIDRGVTLDCAIRKADLAILIAGMNWASRNQDIKIQVLSTENSVVVKSEKEAVILWLPRVDESMPSSYTSQLSRITKKNYVPIIFEKFFESLQILSQVYESSGIVALVMREGKLLMETRTRSNKLSFIMVAEKIVGKMLDQTVYFSISGLLNSLKSLKSFKQMNLFLQKSSFSLFGDAFDFVAFGTDTLAKSSFDPVKTSRS